MDLTNEVGLRLRFSPSSSHIVVRTACCTVGTVLPVYSTFKAIENNDQNSRKNGFFIGRKFLFSVAVYGSFSVVEVFADKILWCVVSHLFQVLKHFLSSVSPIQGSSFCFFHQVSSLLSCKVCFSSLALTSICQWYNSTPRSTKKRILLISQQILGAKHLYMSHLRPFLLRHQAKIDQTFEFIYNVMVGLRLRFSPISSHIIFRTACCTVGTVLPVYSTFKVIENNDQIEQKKWLLYWTGYTFLLQLLSYFTCIMNLTVSSFVAECNTG
ncbi:hypothetical protein CRYUN_Cryun04dG0068700 [Craigia yunnanensis]